MLPSRYRPATSRLVPFACACVLWPTFATAAPEPEAPTSAGAVVEPLDQPLAFPTVQATVNVPELVARERATLEAPVVASFAEGKKVRVSKDSSQGWRRLRLTDGNVAFVERGLTLSAPARGNADEGEETSRASAYVVSLDQLSSLVKSDPTVRPLAEHLTTSDRVGKGVAIGSAIVGMTLVILSITALSNGDCSTSLCGASKPALFGGGVLAILGPLIGWAIWPSGSDIANVVNQWNSRHPDDRLNASLWGLGGGTGAVIQMGPVPIPH